MSKKTKLNKYCGTGVSLGRDNLRVEEVCFDIITLIYVLSL